MFITSISLILRKQISFKTLYELAFCGMDLDIQVREEVEGKWGIWSICRFTVALQMFQACKSNSPQTVYFLLAILHHGAAATRWMMVPSHGYGIQTGNWKAVIQQFNRSLLNLLCVRHCARCWEYKDEWDRIPACERQTQNQQNYAYSASEGQRENKSLTLIFDCELG